MVGNFISSGLIPRLVDVMKREKEPIILLESIWILACLTISPAASRVLDTLLTYPSIITCLTHKRILITEKAAYAIGNLISNRVETRDQLADEV